MHGVEIQPMSHDVLEDAAALAEKIFAHDSQQPRPWFEASLDASKKKEFIARPENNDVGDSIRYWVATHNSNVIGTTGLYTYKHDQDVARWVGWFCLAPHARGQGIGGRLLDFTIAEAKKVASVLRLYTSTHPLEADAQLLYEKRGLREVRKGERIGGYQNIYRELVLKKTIDNAKP